MTETTTTPISDRVKLAFSLDVQKMKEEVNSFDLNDFIYYNVIPLRNAAHLVDPSLPFPPPADDYADGTWTEWMDTPAFLALPYLQSVVDSFRQHTRVTLIRLLRLAPGSEVKEHTDPTLGLEIERSVIRLTIPICGTEGEDFYLNDKIVPMQAGECWYLRLSDPHKITNHGTEARINLTIDMAPNDWVRSMIEKAQAEADPA